MTGGTGSLGNAVIKRFLNCGIKEIRIFSSDVKKQDDMRIAYLDDKLKFYIGDVRDCDGIHSAMHGVDYVFHAAALKQVPSCPWKIRLNWFCMLLRMEIRAIYLFKRRLPAQLETWQSRLKNFLRQRMK